MENELTLGPVSYPTGIELKPEAHLFWLPKEEKIKFGFFGPGGGHHEASLNQIYGRSPVVNIVCDQSVSLRLTELEVLYWIANIEGISIADIAKAKGIGMSGMGMLFHRVLERNFANMDKAGEHIRNAKLLHFQSKLTMMGLVHPDFLPYVKGRLRRRLTIG